MNDEVSRIRRRYEREKAARKEAEQLLESKSLELFNTNQQLRYLAESLEKQVQQRTQELVSARDQALSSARAKSSFLANMSHEIRTPINGVLGMVKLLSDTELNSRQRKLLDTARTSGELLLLVINDILDFTKLEANKLSLETIPFNPREVIEQCTETFASQCFDKDIELVCDVKAQMPQLLEGDPTRLQQILNNLLSNAVKFTHTGTVAVTASYSKQQQLQLTVKDSGIGMTPQQQKNIFQAFSQADETTTRKYGGTGLGLSICRRLIEAMHGELTMTSQVDTGTQFTVTVPLKVIGDSNKLSARSDALKKQRILMVAEDCMSRSLLIKNLRSWNISQIHLCDNTEMASSHMADTDIVIIDRAIDNAKAFSIQCQQAKLNIIQLCALHQLIKTQRDGLFCLSKPVKPLELLDTLMSIIGEGTPQQQQIPQQTNTENGLSGSRILLTEDNRTNQMLAVEFLSYFGCEIDVVDNGEQALKAVQQQPYDLVLMDIQMPVMDGFEATRQIRALGAQFKTLPIIAMTAHALAGDKQKSLAAGMNDHITKPIDSDLLFNMLKEYIADNRQSKAPPHTTTSAPVRQIDIPTLTGIDLAAAMNRVNNNWAALQRILFSFAEEQRDNDRKITTALDDGDYELAIRLAHTLRGSCGNLGMDDVSEQATAIEAYLKEGNTAQARSLLPALSQQLKHVVDAIEQHRQSLNGQQMHTNSEQPDNTLTSTGLLKLIHTIDTSLDNDLGEAEASITQLCANLQHESWHEQLRTIDQSFRNFDFKTLRTCLKQLSTTLSE